MQREDRVRLTHMIEAADAATRFAAGRSRDASQAESTPIPWREIIAMRNRLVHAYFDINTDILWKTVTEEIPAILSVLRAELERV